MKSVSVANARNCACLVTLVALNLSVQPVFTEPSVRAQQDTLEIQSLNVEGVSVFKFYVHAYKFAAIGFFGYFLLSFTI